MGPRRCAPAIAARSSAGFSTAPITLIGIRKPTPTSRPLSRDDLSGKRKCKDALLREFGFPVDGKPLIGIITRAGGPERRGPDRLRRTGARRRGCAPRRARLRRSQVRKAVPGTCRGLSL
jgi:hypothetical protein